MRNLSMASVASGISSSVSYPTGTVTIPTSIASCCISSVSTASKRWFGKYHSQESSTYHVDRLNLGCDILISEMFSTGPNAQLTFELLLLFGSHVASLKFANGQLQIVAVHEQISFLSGRRRATSGGNVQNTVDTIDMHPNSMPCRAPPLAIALRSSRARTLLERSHRPRLFKKKDQKKSEELRSALFFHQSLQQRMKPWRARECLCLAFRHRSPTKILESILEVGSR